MKRVPLDGLNELTPPNGGTKVDQVIRSKLAGDPSPLATNAGHEVAREAVLVGAVPSARFGGARTNEVLLPVWAAVALKELEQGLRLAGLMHPCEFLLQSDESRFCFRVESGDRAIYSRHLSRDSFWGAVHATGPFSGANPKVWGDVQSPLVTEPAPAGEVKRRRKPERALRLTAKRGLDK